LLLKLSNWAFDQEMDVASLSMAFSRLKGVQMTAPRKLEIVKVALDKRKGLRYVYTVEVDVHEVIDVEHMNRENRQVNVNKVKEMEPPPLEAVEGLAGKKMVVVGSGPAGMFAAYALVKSGAEVVVLERGQAVKERLGKVRALFQEGLHDSESNICFGEGGAGTFSDGKLTTRKNHPWIRFIFDFWVECGAPAEISTAGKPHIGTDRLRAVVVTMRKKFIEMGGEVRFETTAKDLVVEGDRVKRVICEGGPDIDEPDGLVWASGHSARDSFHMLNNVGLKMEAKPFAVGVRIEHPQALVNHWLHRDKVKEDLGAADYKVVCNLSETRSVYSFCMCPGGQVVCSSSHGGYHVVNGMSNYARNSDFANSGLVVKVGTEDFGEDDAMAGVRYQEGIEARAYESVGGGYEGPAQRVKDFIEGHKSETLPESSYRPSLTSVDLNEILPTPLCESLKDALLDFEKKFPGFGGDDALLIGTETRTSSPIRIPRNKDGRAENIDNFYPCGEGAGYAGGIVSAALDGLYVAQCLRKRYA
jgi:uncharacterized protein